MKILVCSKLYKPQHTVGAQRWSCLTDELRARGHQVLVISSSPSESPWEIQVLPSLLGRSIQGVINSYRHIKSVAEDHSPLSGKIPVLCSLPRKWIEGILRSARHLVDLGLAIDWAVRGRFMVSRLRDIRPEVIISSYGPLDSLLLGFLLAQRYRDSLWVSDLRDNICNTSYPFWLNTLYRFLQRKSLKRADCVWVVSAGQVDTLARSVGAQCNCMGKVSVLHNGFPTALWRRGSSHLPRHTGLMLVYTGQLYDGKRDLSMLLSALHDLRNLEPGMENVRLHYAGPNSTDFLRAVAVHGVGNLAVDHGNLSHARALKLQQEADILVLLSWNTDLEQGILTAKFYEYMVARKPIICLVSGECPNAELSQLVTRYRLGLGCEYARKSIDESLLKCFLLDALKHKKTFNILPYCGDENAIKSFRYDILAQKAEALLEDALDARHENGMI